MLTDLTFFQNGKQWPPPCEIDRLKKYTENRRIFEDEHSEVYKKQMRRIQRVIGNFDEVVSFPVIFNYQKLMSLKMADLVFGESPKITAADDLKQQVIDRVMIDTDLVSQAYIAALDVSRYGDSIMSVSRSGSTAVVDVQPPALWFPVVEKSNIKRIVYHVIAYHYLASGYDCICDSTAKKYELKVQIHKIDEPGVCEEHTYQLAGAVGAFRIGSEITDTKTYRIDTSFDACPIFRVHNVLTSDRVYGIDDYHSIDSLVSELIIRISQISKILDLHANPSMSGPASALEEDPDTGEWKLKAGGYFAREPEDIAPEYIVWDASFDANFKQIELLINQLYTVSEMGSAVFGDAANKAGQAASGTALRRLMMSPLAKARRVASSFDSALKRIVSLCASIHGVKIEPYEISIKWKDGLPDDEIEMANIMATRTGGKPTISQYSAIQRLDGLSEADTDTELEMIRADEASSNPIVLGAIESNEMGGGDPQVSETQVKNQVQQATGERLNGAQVKSLMEVIAQYSAGSISESAAINLIISAFGMAEHEARKLLGVEV